MLNFQIMTEKDKREAAKIEKKRIYEEERKKRIFNPRTRLIGIDADALKTQIEEKQKKEDDDKQHDRILTEQLLKASEIATALAEQQKQQRIQIEKEINDFRRKFQRPEQSREFDITDPNLIKKQLPPRINDEDKRCGPSAAQIFEGEDLTKEQRDRLQREQIRAWLDQQMQEREQAEKDRRAAEDAYKAAVMARDHRAVEMSELEKICRKRLDEACVRFNKALAAERLMQTEKNKRKTNEDNLAEIYNHMMSDMLTENPDVAVSNLGAGRKIGYLYKGMSEEEKKAFKQYQLEQIEEKRKEKSLEDRMEREYNEYVNGIQNHIYLVDKHIREQKKQQAMDLSEVNLKMSEEQKNQKDFLEKIVYKNVPSEEYYDQFNKTTR